MLICDRGKAESSENFFAVVVDTITKYGANIVFQVCTETYGIVVYSDTSTYKVEYFAYAYCFTDGEVTIVPWSELSAFIPYSIQQKLGCFDVKTSSDNSSRRVIIPYELEEIWCQARNDGPIFCINGVTIQTGDEFLLMKKRFYYTMKDGVSVCLPGLPQKVNPQDIVLLQRLD